MTKVIPTLFTTAGCPFCEEGRVFLRSRGAAYSERDVSVDPSALRDLLFLLGRAEVPVLYAGYHAATGFDPEQWVRVLDHAEALAIEDPFRLPELLGKDPLPL